MNIIIHPRLLLMAKRIASAYMRRLPRTVLWQDIEQAAFVGLWDALRKHPEGEGPAHDWYLRCRIRGEIIDELRRQDWAGRRRRDADGHVKEFPKVMHLDDLTPEWADLLPGKSGDPELLAIVQLDAAKAWLAPLDATDARVLDARYVRGRRQEAVAFDEGMSAPRVSQRESRGLIAMRRHLTGEQPAQPPRPRLRPVALWKQRR